MKNHIEMADLLTMSAPEMVDLPVDQLLLIQQEIAAAADQLKNIKTLFEFTLETKYKESIDVAYEKKGDEYGAADFRDDFAVLKINTPKKVDWDKDILALAEVIIRNDWDGDPDEYMTISRNVTEKSWGVFSTPVKELFKAGRTVEAGKRTIKIEVA
jgi:hypothetical protein